MLKDAPTSFSEYSPDNYERDFKGPIPAWQALVTSRNVPAVALASKMNQPRLQQQAHCFSTHRKRSAPHFPIYVRSRWRIRKTTCTWTRPRGTTLSSCITRKGVANTHSPVSWIQPSHPWVVDCYAVGLPSPYVTASVCKSVTKPSARYWIHVYMNHCAHFSAPSVISKEYSPA